MSKKKLLIASVVFIILALYFGGGSKRYSLSGKIYFAAIENKEVDLAKLTNFEWDNVAIFHPYLDCININEIVRQEYCSPSSHFYVPESENLAIFLFNHKIVKEERLGRLYNFHADAYSKLIPKNKTVFKLVDQKDYPYKVLKLKESK